MKKTIIVFLTAIVPCISLAEPVKSLIGARSVADTGKKQQHVPDEYREVQFLRSDGNQYLFLGTESTSQLALEVDVGITDRNDSCNFLAFFHYSSGRTRGGWAMASSFYIIFGTGNSDTVFNKLSVGDRVVLSYANGIASVKKNGIITSKTVGALYSGSFQVLLLNKDRSASHAIKGSIYQAKVWIGGELKYDLYPCVRKSDGVAGMYNVVLGNFHTNVGTGTFIVGPDF